MPIGSSRAGSQTQILYESPDLELFAKATNWKAYWSDKLRPYIEGRVIEVGAGIGTSTEHMCCEGHPDWLCLDPDPANVVSLRQRIEDGRLPQFCRAEGGVLADQPEDNLADSVLYIDVLEHIEDDQGEIGVAASHLKRGGHLVVLSPAFNDLYSPFDKAVGHYRRYEKSDVARLTVPGLAVRRVFYLDSAGFLLSLMNRMFLKASMPTTGQIRFWDKIIIPISVYSDKVLGGTLGRTIVMIWQKT